MIFNPLADFNKAIFLYPSNTVPPTTVGIAKRNENKTASFNCHPRMQAALIVDPLREIPGISAKACILPINNTSLILLSRFMKSFSFL